MSDDDTKSAVQQQFGAHAQGYVTSRPHAQGPSLARLLALSAPEPGWRVLDVATGGGHTALAFAPRVASVCAVDLTYPMLLAARRFLREQGHAQITFGQVDSEHLPFAAASFDLVTCRIALHHFPDARAAIGEWARVVRPGGCVALADNVVPPDKVAAGFINHLEKERDPSHNWAYPVERLVDLFGAVGLAVRHHETLRKSIDFVDWAERMGIGAEGQARLRARLLSAGGLAREALDPRESDGRLVFDLAEAVIVAVRV
jgi:SAM-dependent methyltransferase